MKKNDKRMIAEISLLVAIVLWLIIFIFLYMHIFTFFIVILVFVTAVFVIAENKLLSTWDNKKARRGFWIIGTATLFAILIIGYNVLLGRFQ